MSGPQKADQIVGIGRRGGSSHWVDDAVIGPENVVAIFGSIRRRGLRFDNCPRFVQCELGALDVVREVALIEWEFAKGLWCG